MHKVREREPNPGINTAVQQSPSLCIFFHGTNNRYRKRSLVAPGTGVQLRFWAPGFVVLALRCTRRGQHTYDTRNGSNGMQTSTESYIILHDSIETVICSRWSGGVFCTTIPIEICRAPQRATIRKARLLAMVFLACMYASFNALSTEIQTDIFCGRHLKIWLFRENVLFVRYLTYAHTVPIYLRRLFRTRKTGGVMWCDVMGW